MATSRLFFFVIALFVATSSTAPTEDDAEVLEIPPECIGQRFCSVKPKGYEEYEKKMNSILPEFLKKEYADRDGTPLSPPVLSPKEDWHNCPYITKTELWYAAFSNDTQNTKIIIQTETFAQYVESVTCAVEYIKTDSQVQCFEDLGVNPAFNMQSTCETSYARRTLLVFDIKRNVIVQKPFDVPACCKCSVSYMNDRK